MIWIVNILVGLVILILALAIKIFKLSFLIAGYNTASKKEKEKYDEKKLVNYVGNMLIIVALILIIGGLPSILGSSLENLFFIGSWIIFTIFIIAAVIIANLTNVVKKNGNEKRN